MHSEIEELEHTLRRSSTSEFELEKNSITRKIQEISQDIEKDKQILARLQDPQRLSATQCFNNALIAAETSRSTLLEKAKTRTYTLFDKGAPDIGNFTGLNSIISATKHFMDVIGMNPDPTSEYQRLVTIRAQMTYLQFLLNDDNGDASKKQQQIQDIKNDITQKIDSLLVDNPLRAAKNLIRDITSPSSLPPAPTRRNMK